MATAQALSSAADFAALRVQGRFSRSSLLNAALQHLQPDELSVVLDIDMSVQPDFFQHARAFAVPGE